MDQYRVQAEESKVSNQDQALESTRQRSYSAELVEKRKQIESHKQQQNDLFAQIGQLELVSENLASDNQSAEQSILVKQDLHQGLTQLETKLKTECVNLQAMVDDADKKLDEAHHQKVQEAIQLKQSEYIKRDLERQKLDLGTEA